MQNDYIGIMADDMPGLFTGILAILKSGNCFVPINPVFPNDRIRFIINDCKISLLLTDKTNYQKGRQVVEGTPCVKHILCIDDIPEMGIEEADKSKNFDPFFYCYVIYTSGSTGRPKGVPITHENLIPLFYWFRDYFCLGVHTRVMQNLSYTFDFGIFEILTTLLFGGSMYVVNKASVSDFSTYASFINRHHINTLHTTPVFFSHIANSGRRMPFIKLLHLGGERLSGNIVSNAAAIVAPGCHIYNGYGPTEATINCTIFGLPTGKGENPDEGATVPIGRPSALNEIYIMDQSGNLQPIGAAGELCVTGPGLAKGYLNHPELTAEKFSLGKSFSGVQGAVFQKSPLVAEGKIYRTGDLARWLANGNIEFLGRIDHQVKVRGFRIELGEIENCLLKHPGIKEAVVIAREHENGSNYLCSYIVTRDLQSLAVSQLREHLSRELPDYMIPAYFIPVEEIPLTASGKIDRKALPEPDETVIETGTAYAAPVTETEKKLVFIWQQLLRMERIGINDDFFELGGDSILVNQCIARIREELQVEIPLRKFFERPYIKALAEEIQKQKQQVSAIKPAKRGEEIPLSFAQERLWFLQELDAENAAYFVPRIIRLKGKLDIGLIERTFTQIIRRHEILRTTFPTVDGRPVQCIHPPYVFKIPVMDWSKEDEEGQNQKVCDFIEQEGQQLFDFENGPLLRVTMLKLKEEEYLFVLTEHHLIHDGWTQGVLLKEFVTIFTAYSEGKEHQLPELPIQYADYAVWQREFLKGKVLERHLDYWKEKLAGLEPVLELPADHPRPPVISGEGALKVFHLSNTFTWDLKAFSRKNGVTLFMTMLAVFKTLLYRYTGVEDLCVGTGIANRKYKEMEGMLGMVINTLPLRGQAAGDILFREYLQRVKAMCLEAYQHEDTPFGKIVEVMKPERNLSYTPIFQVLFSFMDTPTHDLRLPGLKLEVEPTHNRSAKFDINVVVVPPEENSGETLVEWEYNIDIFDAPTMDRMIAHYTRLLTEVVHTPGETLASLSMLSEQETRQLLYTFNDTTAEYPVDKTIHQLFEEQSIRTPDCIVIVGAGSVGTRFIASDVISITYKKLNETSNQLAGLLMEKGLQPNDIAAILGERSVEMVLGILAILKAGGTYLPIDADYPEERIDYMLKDSKARILLSEGSKVNGRELACLFPEVIDLKEIIKKSEISPTHPTHLTHPTHPGYIMYTSGSTGQPKGVMVTHRNVVRLVKNTNYVPLTRETRILQTGAPVFDATTFEIWGSLLNGGQLVLVDREVILDARQLGDALIDHLINTLWLSAPLFNQLMQQDIELFAPLRYLLVGGDVLSPPHINRVKQRFPSLEIINGYGPTENTTFSTTYSIEKEFEHHIPIGSPIANSTVYIYDKNSQLVPVGVWGELVVGGDGVSQGYLNSPELTNSKFQAPAGHPIRIPNSPLRFSASQLLSFSLYRTGDLARWLSNGTIEFKGRLDQQVKIRGFRIELGEIENQLLKHKQIKEAVVIDRKDQGEKYLCAYVVPHGTHGAWSMEHGEGGLALKEFLSQTLPDYMIPSFVIPLDKIPLNPNGKVDRKLLPEPDVQGTETTGEYTAPRDTVEKKLADIWAEVLNIRTAFGIDDNFFDLGGHSLNAALLVARMHKVFHVKIPLIEFFKKGCIREVAQYIREAARETFSAIEAAEEKEYYPLSAAQKRLYILHQIDRESIGYNIPSIMVLEGALDRKQLEDAFIKLIERHESLRTSFTTINDQPVQRIHKKAAFAVEDFHSSFIETPDHFIRVFDLSKAPLMRVGLVNAAEEKYLLLVDLHHIVTDGISMGLVVKDFMALYQGKTLPALNLQYKDYTAWQTRESQKESIKRQEEWWLEQLSGEIRRLDLPVDFPRPAQQSFEGRRVHFQLDREEAAQLKTLAAEESATLYMVLLSLVNVLLAKLSGAEEVVVGTPVAARRHADLHQVIGMFVNTLVIKNVPTGNKTFKEFLKEVKHKTLKIFENQDYPFEDLVERLNVPRDMSRNPLFDVFFILQNIDIPEIQVPGLTLKPYPYEYQAAKFDLTLQAVETNGTLTFIYEYAVRLFKPSTIERLILYLKTLISDVLHNPHQKISRMRVIPEQERDKILYEFNATQKKYPKGKTIHQLFKEQAEQSPDNIALVDHIISITYKELDDKSEQLAHLLKVKGVGPGTRDSIVGIMVERSMEMVIGILGILKAGGGYMPIDPNYPGERIKYMLSDSGAGILVSKVSEVSKLSGGIEVIEIDEIFYSDEVTGPTPPTHLTHPTHLCYILYTSGSTGRPKGVVVEHESVVNLLYDLFERYPLGETDAYLLKTSFTFDVSVTELFGWWTGGGRLVILGKGGERDPRKIIHTIEKQQVTHINFVPSMFNVFLHSLDGGNTLDTAALRSLKYIFAAGEALPPELVHTFNRLNSGIPLENLYGPTEGTVYASGYSLKDWHTDGKQPVPIGKPIDNVQLLVVNKHLQLQPAGVPGELHIGGAGVARGYLNNPELTAEKFNRSYKSYRTYIFYKTGDLARWLPDGNVEFLGRIDHQVKIRGYRIELEEIQGQLLKHKGIKEAVVVDIERQPGDKYLCAYIVPEPAIDKPGPFQLKELKEFLSRRLPEYMIPSYFVPLEAIPLTPSGKTDRKSLPLPDGDIDIGIKYVPARSQEEKTITRVWQEVLKLNKIGIYDNFFDRGGNSLKLIEIQRRLEKLFKRQFPMVILFQYPRISSLAEYVSRGEETHQEKPGLREKEINKGKDKLKNLKKRMRAH